MRSRRAWPLIVSLAVAACTTSPSATTVSLPPVSSAPVPTAPDRAECQDRGDFVEGGDVASLDNPGSDARTIGEISWETSGNCETFTISFMSSEGAPATTPPTSRVAYLDPVPVIRLSVDTDATVITDQLVGTNLVDRLFVVHGLDGQMFIDVHLRTAATARVSSEGSPAAIVLELAPGIIEPASRPLATDRVVVLEPMEGVATASPVTVTGYARKADLGIVVIATSGDVVLGEHLLEPAGTPDTWGEFVTTLALDEGTVSLFVGEELPGSGGLDGVTIPVTVG